MHTENESGLWVLLGGLLAALPSGAAPLTSTLTARLQQGSKEPQTETGMEGGSPLRIFPLYFSPCLLSFSLHLCFSVAAH